MNDRIRAVVTAQLEEKQLTHTDLARMTGTTSPAITRALEATGKRGGTLTQLWSDIIDALDLELMVIPRQDA
jgi:alpha-ketoglutarate-dependent taurine dioxygenase